MARLVVASASAVALRRRPGTTITLVNQSAVDVYFDRDEADLNRSLPGAVPSGTLLPNGGGTLQWPDFPGVLWFRAVSPTEIQVQP